MKSNLVIALVALILISLIAVSCSSGVSGKYINEHESTEYILIMEDGTYQMGKEGGEGTLQGVWEVKDDTLILNWGSLTFEYEIRGNKLVDYGGIFWVKE